jgi:hypothetical protein
VKSVVVGEAGEGEGKTSKAFVWTTQRRKNVSFDDREFVNLSFEGTTW